MNKTVIFLDVDGVLNYGSCKESVTPNIIGIDSDKVKLLADIVQAVNGIIVLTSTWQAGWEQDESECDVYAKYLNKKIAEFGLKITSKTDVYGWDRGAGIICWLENNPGYDKWIVIDDEIFPDYKKYGITAHLIKTTWYGGKDKAGLQPKHIRLAKKLVRDR